MAQCGSHSWCGTDKLSSEIHIGNEWKLDPKLLKESFDVLGSEPQIDFSASTPNLSNMYPIFQIQKSMQQMFSL